MHNVSRIRALYTLYTGSADIRQDCVPWANLQSAISLERKGKMPDLLFEHLKKNLRQYLPFIRRTDIPHLLEELLFL